MEKKDTLASHYLETPLQARHEKVKKYYKQYISIIIITKTIITIIIMVYLSIYVLLRH